MPSQLSYPGVYVEEIRSSVHAITGVSTSVTAFVGAAKRGPINRAVQLFSFADFEKSFGGLDPDSEMSYAVRQFFLNGGSEAWAIRLAKNPSAATVDLLNGATAVLTVTAKDQGKAGNNIEVRVDHDTANPDSTFNLTVNFVSADNPGDNASESFVNLTMNPDDVRYAPALVNDASELITLTDESTVASSVKGTSTSPSFLDVATLFDASHCQFRISANGLDPVDIIIDPAADLTGGTPAARLATLCGKIQGKVVAAANGAAAYSSLLCSVVNTDQIQIKSGKGGGNSTVRVLPGAAKDVSTRLKFGPANGGVEVDAAASVRPDVVPLSGTLTSGTITISSVDPTTENSFRLTLDGLLPLKVSLLPTALSGDKLANQADRIQTAVRALRPNIPTFADFTCAKSGSTLVLTSGTAGKGSSVKVEAVLADPVAGTPADDLADKLKLSNGTSAPGENVMLIGGTESPYTDTEAYGLFIGSRDKREGVFALEAVDIFNLLVLPGVSDGGIVADALAYCKERRAFLIVDPPPDKDKPAEIEEHVTGPALPKDDYTAVFYPWVSIADPLASGRPRLVAPGGTMAGVFARTDSTRGVWKAPAGTEATLAGVQGAAYVLTDKENGALNPHGINCLRIFPVIGPVSWGARTLRGDDQMASEWKYIPVRRLALFLEESLYRGTKWAVFEPNDEPLWAQLRLNIGAFMQTQFRLGAFAGATPRDAYFVKCDKETTTQSDVNLGVVNVLIGFAPLKPAEFVVLKFQQMAGQIAT